MKSRDTIGSQLDKHTAEKDAVVGWCTGSHLIAWNDFIGVIQGNVPKIRKLAPDDPWQSLSLGEIKKWWPTQYE